MWGQCTQLAAPHTQATAHLLDVSAHFGVTADTRRYRSLSDEGGLGGGLTCLTSGMAVSLLAP